MNTKNVSQRFAECKLLTPFFTAWKIVCVEIDYEKVRRLQYEIFRKKKNACKSSKHAGERF